MSDATSPPRDAAAAPRRWRRRAAIAIALLLVLALSLRWLTRPEQALPLLLARIGATLGLEIEAEGGDYALRGTPRLVLRHVVARQPGEAPLLRAERIDLLVPWSTLRARGREPVVERIEIDGATLDVAALQAWLDTRPESDGPMPTLTRGFAVRESRLLAEGWIVEQIEFDVPRFVPGAPLQARVGGRYVSDAVAATTALQASLDRTGLPAAITLRGRVEVEGDDWRLPSTVALDGALHAADDARPLRLERARFGALAAYVDDATRVPFRIGLAGPLHWRDGVLWQRVDGAALRPGANVVPTLDARGAFAVGEQAVVDLRGTLAAWPDAWPALPPPIGTSRAPLPFALRYAGDYGFDAPLSLRLRRDDATFDARFALPRMLAWIDAAGVSPLPPLDGTLRSPRLEVAGAVLEGVEIGLRDGPTP
ncbi:hypothetical protein SD81_032405 [Tolypothrix campylonemoides VB511288]|nr:hypothetical protein SD81_032405 [Tolypothrix campylonemoides VB511288]